MKYGWIIIHWPAKSCYQTVIGHLGMIPLTIPVILVTSSPSEVMIIHPNPTWGFLKSWVTIMALNTDGHPWLDDLGYPQIIYSKRIAQNEQSIQEYPYDLGKHHIIPMIFKITLKKSLGKTSYTNSNNVNITIISKLAPYTNWLVVYLPLWKMMEFVSWDDDIPFPIWKVIIHSCSSHHQPDHIPMTLESLVKKKRPRLQVIPPALFKASMCV